MKAVPQLQNETQCSIQMRVGLAVADVHTIIRAKSSPDLRALSRDFTDLGGGNFLTAIAGVVLLESLAITLACLEDKSLVVTDDDIRQLKELREEFREGAGISKSKLKTLDLQNPRPGVPKNLEQCVIRLDERVNQELNIVLGYVKAASQKHGLWALIRNNLAHRFAPGWGASAAAVGVGWLETSPDLANDRAWFTKFNLPVFDLHENGTVYVTGDFLVLSYLPRIADWICSVIGGCSDLETLQLVALNNLVSLE